MDPDNDSESESESYPVPAAGWKFNPWLFFIVLFIPAVISIAVLFNDDSNYGESALNTLIVASIIAGIFCGVHFAGAQRSQSIGMKIVIGIISIVGCAGAAFALGFGCCYLIMLVLGGL